MKRYAIGPLHLDVEQRVLYAGSEVVGLSPKSFDILLVLVENAGQVMSRDAIREQVWGDAFIEDANLSNNISMLRSALREHLGDVPVIKTFSKRGYQFTTPAGVEDLGAERTLKEEDLPRVAVSSVESPVARGWLPPASVWKTRSNLILLGLFAFGLTAALTLIRMARTGVLLHRPAIVALLAGMEQASLGLKRIDPVPSLLATVALFSLGGLLGVLSRRRPDLRMGRWLLAVSFLTVSQVVWIVSKETAVRTTIGLLGQVLCCLTLAAYKPERAPLRRWWVFYVDILPLVAFVVLCGLDVEKAGIYVGLSAVGRVMLLGTYLLRRDAWLPVVIAVVGWIGMALLAAAGQYRGAAFSAIAVLALYAAVNLSLRLPRGNLGKTMLVVGMLVWALYAGTFPAAFAYAPLLPLWSLLLGAAKVLVCVGMILFVLETRTNELDAA